MAKYSPFIRFFIQISLKIDYRATIYMMIHTNLLEKAVSRHILYDDSYKLLTQRACLFFIHVNCDCSVGMKRREKG